MADNSERGVWALTNAGEKSLRKKKGLPDITFLIVRKDSGYPGQIGFTRRKTPGAKQKVQAREEVQAIIDKYNPGAANPYP